MEHLVKVSEIKERYGDNINGKLRAFMVLMGWEFDRYRYKLPRITELGEMSDKKMKDALRSGTLDVDSVADEARLFAQGMAEMDIFIKEKGKEGRLQIDFGNLIGAVYENMTWFENYSDVTSLPKGEIKIGKHCYRLPSALLANMCYQQYSQAQMALGTIWKMSKSGEEIIKRLEEWEENTSAQLTDTEGRNAAGEPQYTRDELEEMLMEHEKEIRDARYRFVAQMLTMKRVKTYKVEIKKTWVPYPTVKTVYDYSYDSGLTDIIKADIMADGKEWLFDLLYAFMQNCLAWYDKQYPTMFQKADEKDDKSPWISLIDQSTCIMKYSGTYTNAEEVMKEVMPVVFSWFNHISTEALLAEKMEAEARRRNMKR